MNNSKHNKKIKIVLLGDKAVGKSSIIKRFITNQFQEYSNPTIGVDFLAKNIKFKNYNFRLQLWDTAGQEKYRSLVKGYLKGAHACIYVYDCTNFGTYHNLLEWIDLFQSVASSQAYSIVVGNKSDLSFNKQQLQSQKQKFWNIHSNLPKLTELQVSAKLGQNINEIFEKILDQLNKQQFKQDKTQLIKNVDNINCCRN